jgi:hypothetical protein
MGSAPVTAFPFRERAAVCRALIAPEFSAAHWRDLVAPRCAVASPQAKRRRLVAFPEAQEAD